MNTCETDLPETLVDGDGKNERTGRGNGKNLPNQVNKADTTSLEDALSLVEKLDRIAIVGAPAVIPNKDMADFLSRKLAKSIAYHPDVRNGAYIQELVDNGFAKRNAQKIVWTARKLSRSLPIDATIRTLPVESTPATGSGIVPAPQTADPLPRKRKYQRGDNLWRNHNEMFRGYEKNNYKRERSGKNPAGTYFPDNSELKKYGTLWAAIGFHMVPEDLPKILPVLRGTGLLDVYKVDPALVQELEEEREKMLAAGMDMRLTIPSENRDQVIDSPA
ncbi:hypothetical protein HF563_12025 [Acidithiobacillus ferridurans]|nr:hypothetical protein [Acidithiobacillus ferridurans]